MKIQKILCGGEVPHSKPGVCACPGKEDFHFCCTYICLLRFLLMSIHFFYHLKFLFLFKLLTKGDLHLLSNF